jgi:hypothetical protein
MKTASFYQSTADAIGMPLYLYADGSVAHYRKVDTTNVPLPAASARSGADHAFVPGMLRRELRPPTLIRGQREEQCADQGH